MPSLALQVSACVFFALLQRACPIRARKLPKSAANYCFKTRYPHFWPFASLHFAVLNPFSLADIALDHFHSGGKGKSEKLVCKLQIFLLLAESVFGGRTVCFLNLDAPDLVLGRNLQ